MLLKDSPKHEREKLSFFKDNIIYLEDLKDSTNQLLEKNLARLLKKRLIYKFKFYFHILAKKKVKKAQPFTLLYCYLSNHKSSKRILNLHEENLKTLMKDI